MDKDIVPQGEFFGFAQLRLAPIHGAERETLEDYAKDLEDWLSQGALEAFPAICFLDITYFDLFKQEAPYTLITGPKGNPTRYKNLLLALVQGGEFFLGNHPVFRSGLPIVAGKVPDTLGEFNARRDEEVLANALLGLLCRERATVRDDAEALEGWERVIIAEEEYAQVGLPEAIGRLAEESRLDDMWEKFCQVIFAANLCSCKGQPLRTLVAMPVGVWGTDGQFINLANVYIGLADSRDSPATHDLLTKLQLHIFMSNAYQLGKGTGELDTARLFAHQAAGMLTGIKQSKSELSAEASYKLEHLLRLTSIWTTTRVTERADAALAKSTPQETWERLLRGAVDQAIYRLIERRQAESLRNIEERIIALQGEQADESNTNDAYENFLDRICTRVLRVKLTASEGYPEWIRSEAFVLAGHHQICQAAFHALRAAFEDEVAGRNSQNSYLAIDFSPRGVVIRNVAVPPGVQGRTTDDAFFYAVNIKTKGILTVSPPRNDQSPDWRGWVVSTITLAGSGGR